MPIGPPTTYLGGFTGGSPTGAGGFNGTGADFGIGGGGSSFGGNMPGNDQVANNGMSWSGTPVYADPFSAQYRRTLNSSKWRHPAPPQLKKPQDLAGPGSFLAKTYGSGLYSPPQAAVTNPFLYF